MRLRPVFAGTVAIGATAMVFLTILARLAPEVDRGRLLDWIRPDYEIARARPIGIDVYVDTSFSTGDLAAGLSLMAVAVVAAFVAVRIRRAGESRHANSFGLIAAGAVFLALDEMLAVHETIGYNLPALKELPGVQHPGDLILVAYLLVAVAMLWDRRDVLAAAPIGRALLAGAALMAAGAFACDLLFERAGYVEERLEVLAGGVMLLGLVDLAVEHLRQVAPLTEAAVAQRERARS